MSNMSILGSNYLLSNTISGVADPSVGYVNSNSIDDIQQRKHSDGAMYQMNNGQAGDSFTFTGGNGNALFTTDKGDTVTLQGNWTDTKQVVQDAVSGIWGRLFTDDKGDKAVVSGKDTIEGADVKLDNSSGPTYGLSTKGQIRDDITKIENDPNAKALGKNTPGLLTQQEIQKAIDDGTLTGDDKSFFADVANNFSSFDSADGGRVGGDGLVDVDDIAFHKGIKDDTIGDIYKKGDPFPKKPEELGDTLAPLLNGDPSAPEVQPDMSLEYPTKSRSDIANDIAKMETYLKSNGGSGSVDGTVTKEEILKAVTEGNLFTGDNKDFWLGVEKAMANNFNIHYGPNNTVDSVEVKRLSEGYSLNIWAKSDLST